MKEVLLALGACIVILVVLFAYILRDNTTSNSDSSYGKICLDGVVYWRGYQTLSVKYNRDGSVELCK
jgi:hypothetical protein